jgi:hypothetical protein
MFLTALSSTAFNHSPYAIICASIVAGLNRPALLFSDLFCSVME